MRKRLFALFTALLLLFTLRLSVCAGEDSTSSLTADDDTVFDAPAAGSVQKLTYRYIVADRMEINGKSCDPAAEISYYRRVLYSGKKIKADRDLQAKVSCPALEELAKDLSGAADASGLLRFKYSAKKNKKCGADSYFTVRASLNRSAAKNMGLRGKALKSFNKALKAFNKAAKSEKMRFLICRELDAEEKEVIMPAPVKISSKAFPDAAFREVISGPEYDSNKNGTLDVDEISRVINIHCESKNIKSLKGVEFFTALQGLWCMDNQIAELNLEKNRDLRGLWCSDNKLKKLDLTENEELLWVYCYDCEIRYLNVSNNPKLAFIECNTNPLAMLDVSHNPELEHLTCGTCGLKRLELGDNPKLTHLYAFRNSLTSLDVSRCPKMRRLDIWDNQGLGSIDVSNNPELQYYNCAHNGAASVDVSNNPELFKLICSYNDIHELDLTHNPKLAVLDVASNDLSALDISANRYLYYLQAFTNSFTTLDIGRNPFLLKTYAEGEKKDESAVCKGHSWTIDYGGDTSTGGDNIYYLCFDDATQLSSAADPAVSVEEDPYVYSDADSAVSENRLVKREDVILTLYKKAGDPAPSLKKSRFADVDINGEYGPALLWAEENHIAYGFPNISSDDFGMGKWITRQDLLLMLMRYSEYKSYVRAIDFGRSDPYIDYFDVDYIHWEAVCWSATHSIMEGRGEAGAPKDKQKIDPRGRVSKEDLQKVLDRLEELNS